MIRAVCLLGLRRRFPTVYLTVAAFRAGRSTFAKDHNRRFGPTGRRMAGMTRRAARDPGRQSICDRFADSRTSRIVPEAPRK
jgi:hypothetical protein